MKVLSLIFLLAGFAYCEAGALRESQQRVGVFNEYYAYTRTNFRTATQILPIAASVAASPLVAADDTVIIVHDQGGSAATSLNLPLRDAFLRIGEYNIITVDWSIYASQAYATASLTVPRIAASLAEFIQLLVYENVVELSRVHLVGFGLGAHVVGIAGRTLDGEVARITGLDPSGSGWGSNLQRLSPSDAQYVEVIHTDGFTARANGIGEAIGHVDFFANNGRSSQPGCSNNDCSHNRAWELFEASLINSQLEGRRCNNIAEMTSNRCNGAPLALGGTDYDKFGSGIYRVATGRVSPF